MVDYVDEFIWVCLMQLDKAVKLRRCCDKYWAGVCARQNISGFVFNVLFLYLTCVYVFNYVREGYGRVIFIN